MLENTNRKVNVKVENFSSTKKWGVVGFVSPRLCARLFLGCGLVFNKQKYNFFSVFSVTPCEILSFFCVFRG